ncbi:MAG: L,D-transpeptidase [Motiliproteus sp.]
MTEQVSLVVSLANQTLRLQQNSLTVREFSISSATNGPGELSGSECTPRGRHYIRAKIGAQSPSRAVFVGRRASGEIYSSQLAASHPERDWILTRILWLCGSEVGKNRLGNVDSMRRYIYIHGTPDTEPMGIPASHGCIRMRNDDIIWLFDRLEAGTPVLIKE